MDASEPANTLSEMHDIAPAGDIVLIVGDGKTQLRVHSVCMRTVSRVFDAMFGPHFSEGQPSNGVLPKAILMPDDNAAAMTTICNVVHHRNDVLPDALESREVVQVALAADKYDCVLALKYVMIRWLDFKNPVTFTSLGHFMRAAYVFENSNAFRRITQMLITGTPNSYHHLLDERYDEITPWSIYHSLEIARNRTRLSLQDMLLKEMAYKKCCFCDHASKKAYAHMQALRDNDLWGASLFDITLVEAIEKARKMNHPTFCYEDEFCQFGHEEQQTKEARDSKLKDLTNSPGLCLGCVRSGNIDADLPCIFNH